MKLKLKNIAKWVLIFSIFFFLGKLLYENWDQIREASLEIRIFPLILSIFIFALSYFVQVWAWYLITSKLGIALCVRETLISWFYSLLGKYLPGKIWIFLGRFYYYSSKGKSKRLILTALYFEMITMITGGGIIFLVSLILFQEKYFLLKGSLIGWLSLLFTCFLFFLHPKILEKFINELLMRIKKEKVELNISYFNVLKILLICIFAWIIGGMGFYFFIDSIYHISAKHFLFYTGALAISSTLGLIAFFAPAGLGIREGALMYLLSQLLPTPIAAILSLFTRIWMTLIEIGLIGILYIFFRIRSERRF